MRVYCLKQKSVIRFEPKAKEFIQAYTSNVLTASQNAFLDRQGRIVATFYQKALSDDNVLAVVESFVLDRLKIHLKPYMEFSKTQIKPTDYFVFHDLDQNLGAGPSDEVIPLKAGRLILSRFDYPANVLNEEYTLFRIQHGIPIQGMDYDQDMLLNLGDESFVSYEKGCYLGQEIIARIHYKSKPPKKLVVRYEDECEKDEQKLLTSKVKNPSNGRFFGFIFAKGDDTL